MKQRPFIADAQTLLREVQCLDDRSLWKYTPRCQIGILGNVTEHPLCKAGSPGLKSILLGCKQAGSGHVKTVPPPQEHNSNSGAVPPMCRLSAACLVHRAPTGFTLWHRGDRQALLQLQSLGCSVGSALPKSLNWQGALLATAPQVPSTQ